MLKIEKVNKFDLFRMNKVAHILYLCGKDMAKRYDLHHWDNPYVKSLIIVALGELKNTVYLLYDEKDPVATFQVKKNGDAMHFEKLGTLPQKAGNGLGTSCMKQIEAIAKNANCDRVTMDVYEPSQHAITFYEHRGYTRIGVKETLKYKEIVMEKRI